MPKVEVRCPHRMPADEATTADCLNRTQPPAAPVARRSWAQSVLLAPLVVTVARAGRRNPLTAYRAAQAQR